MRTRTTIAFLAAVAMLSAGTMRAAESYEHFGAAIYARAYEVREMGDLEKLRARFDVVQKHAKVSKVYLETHRDRILVDHETLEKAKAFFAERGVRTSGGITLTIDERNRFETFCYSDPEHRKWVQQVVEHTTRHFDEVILDDFFFTSCKSDVEIRARGGRTWTEYRLALLDEAARNLVLAPARAANPRVKVIIKYPNWYDHFHGLGFDLEKGPRTFDAIYSGTETRDAVRSASTCSRTTATRSSATSTTSGLATTPAAGWTRVACVTWIGTRSSSGSHSSRRRPRSRCSTSGRCRSRSPRAIAPPGRARGRAWTSRPWSARTARTTRPSLPSSPSPASPAGPSRRSIRSSGSSGTRSA